MVKRKFIKTKKSKTIKKKRVKKSAKIDAIPKASGTEVRDSKKTISPEKSKDADIIKKNVKEKDININITFDLKETSKPQSMDSSKKTSVESNSKCSKNRDLRCEPNEKKKKFNNAFAGVDSPKKSDLNSKKESSGETNKNDGTYTANLDKRTNSSSSVKKKITHNIVKDRNIEINDKKDKLTDTVDKNNKGAEEPAAGRTVSNIKSPSTTDIVSSTKAIRKIAEVIPINKINSQTSTTSNVISNVFPNLKTTVFLPCNSSESNVTAPIDMTSKNENQPQTSKSESQEKPDVLSNQAPIVPNNLKSESDISSKAKCTCPKNTDQKTAVRPDNENCAVCSPKIDGRNPSKNKQQDKGLDNNNLFGTPQTKTEKK